MESNEIFYNLSNFVLTNSKEEKDAFELFNKWQIEENFSIKSYKDAICFIQYIDMLINTDAVIIADSLSKDKKIIEGDF